MCICVHHRAFSFGLPKADGAHRCGSGEPPLRRRSWLALAGSGVALLVAAPSVVAAKLYGKPVNYDYVSSGIIKGSQQTVRMPDGRLDVRFEFIDRGRGPKTRSLLAFDDRGFIAGLHTTGYDYYKAAVDESFVVAGDRVRWKNKAEREDRPSADSRFYVSMDGSPEELAAMARALLKARGPVPLWPSGEATLNAAGEQTVSLGAAKRSVRLYEISGLDFAPDQVWLDADGALFMSGSQWGAVVPEGWSGVLPQLFAVQDAREDARGRAIARSLARHPAGAVAIVNCDLFDAKAGRLVPSATIVIDGEHIVAAGGPETPIPAGAQRIDATGKTVLPGLWNSHMHMDASFGPRLLAEGVTTIRDPGNHPAYISKLKAQHESGELAGPRILIAGLIDGGGKYTAPIGTYATDAASASAQVRAWKDLGAVQIKLYSSFDPALVPGVVAEAHALGMRVSGHIPAGMLAEDAVRQGFDEIQHVNFLFLNFMPDVVAQTQTPVRLTAPAERAGTIDLTSAPVQAFIALLKERGTVSDPTVAIFYDDACHRNGELATSGFAEIADWLPPQVKRGLLSAALPVAPGKDAAYRASGDAYLKMVALLHENGVPIVAGTDDVLPGFDTIRELELYVKAGLSPAAALQAATIVPARVMKMDASLGSLEAGKVADLIIVDGNPLDDISQLRRVETTIKGGVLYDSRALYASAGVTAPALSHAS
jgi:imidazolonepropionase-like amidohydrolase